jgi:hypothetical protein
MKKNRILGFALILVVFSLANCDVWNSIFVDPIVGTWQATAVSSNGTAVPVGSGPTEVSQTLTVLADKTVTMSGKSRAAPISATGTWSRIDATYKIVLTMTTGTETYSGNLGCTLSADNKTLNASGTWTDAAGSSNAGSVTFARQ